MSALEKIKVLLGIVKNTFKKITSETGVEIFYDGDELTVDTIVYDSEGNPIPDGEYTDGEKVYEITDSKVTEISNKEEEVDETIDEVKEEVKVEDAEEEKPVEEETIDEVKVEEKPTEEEKPVDENGEEITLEGLKNRCDSMEKVMEDMFQIIMEIKNNQTESITKQEEIVREFASMKHSPSVESITKDNSTEKMFSDCESNKSNKLKALKEKK